LRLYIFRFNFAVFVDGTQKYVLPQGVGYPCYATASYLGRLLTIWICI